MIRIERLRHTAQSAASAALDENMRLGDKRGRFGADAVFRIATEAALVALRDHIRATALADVQEITELLSPNPGVEMEAFRRLLTMKE